MAHRTVLLKEAIDNLDVKRGDVFVDGTLGGGGHSEEVCRRFGCDVKIVGIDLDQDALKKSAERLKVHGCDFVTVNESFRNVDKVLAGLGIEKADRILLDIGLSSDQFEESGRGFSFQKDEPLLMTMKKEVSPEDLTAKEIVNSWDEKNIAQIISAYGEEKFAGRIARKITEERRKKPINTSGELARIISESVPFFYKRGRIHPATKTFQALRITVNDEIRALREGLRKGFECLKPSGRMAVISFHSLEDREVKNFSREMADEGKAKLINKRPIIAGAEELSMNPRARSAKLRVFEKIGDTTNATNTNTNKKNKYKNVSR